jgi:hypothetical protein
LTKRAWRPLPALTRRLLEMSIPNITAFFKKMFNYVIQARLHHSMPLTAGITPGSIYRDQRRTQRNSSLSVYNKQRYQYINLPAEPCAAVYELGSPNGGGSDPSLSSHPARLLPFPPVSHSPLFPTHPFPFLTGVWGYNPGKFFENTNAPTCILTHSLTYLKFSEFRPDVKPNTLCYWNKRHGTNLLHKYSTVYRP